MKQEKRPLKCDMEMSPNKNLKLKSFVLFFVLIWASMSLAASDQGIVYYPDPAAADQGATLNVRSIKSLLTAIGTSKSATINISNTSSTGTTTYTISTNIDASTHKNVRWIIEKGAILSVAGGKTLTMGPPEAGRYQIFSGTGTVKFSATGNIGEVYAEWFPISVAGSAAATGLQAAIDSMSTTKGQTVSIGSGTTIDIVGSTVTLRTGTILKGENRYNSKINMANGSVSFGPYISDSKRYKILENLTITNTGSTSKTVDLGDVGATLGPFESIVRDCNISGGKYAVYDKNTTSVSLENNYISNDVDNSAIFAVYSVASSSSGALSLKGNRIAGKVYLGATSAAYFSGVDISGLNIFESTYGYLLTVDYTVGLNVAGNYFESYRDIPLIVIKQHVYGGAITGNIIGMQYDVKNSTNIPLSIDGGGLNVSGNWIRTSTLTDTTTGIALTANSARCQIGTNYSNQDKTIYVTNSGSGNKIWPIGLISKTTTQGITVATRNTKIFSKNIGYNTLRTGQGVVMEVAGVITGGNNTKVIKWLFGDHTPIDLLPAENVTGNWFARVWIEALSDTSQKIQYQLWVGNTLKSQGYYTDAETMTGLHEIGIYAQCTNAGDRVTSEMGTVQFR